MRTAQGIVSGLFAGRYAIERALGEGATATVFLARDTTAGISVAIKMLRPELAQSAASSRFVKEIKRMTALSHPRILSLIDSGEHEGQMYLVLPYMEGGTLRDRLRREKQLPIDEAIAIVQPIAQALDYAHAQGLIHRDVKPENILFTGGQPVLGDFGIARALETVLTETSTSTGIVRGTPAYMSPEQASGSMDYDGRSDIYALGCVLYEMLAGMPAFIGPTPEAVIAQRFAFPPREIRVYRPSVPPALEAVISKSLAIAPADRYKTAREFGDELARAPAVVATSEFKKHRDDAPRPRALWAGALGLAALAGLTALWQFVGSPTAATQADTTRLVVLPFEDASAGVAPEDLLFEGLRRWRGLSIVETFATQDAIHQRGSIATLADARAVASSLGAGRFIRGRIIRNGATQSVYAALYDVTGQRELYHASVALPREPADMLASYSSLADSLLLRGSRDGAPVSSQAGTTSLPATQAFLAGRAALGEWDLAAADSFFARAVDMDAGFSRAHLWRAQVRSWRGERPAVWQANAYRAYDDSARLSPHERDQARGLRALAAGQFADACAAYRRMTVANPRDFMAWYGLGECHRRDPVVVQDQSSPSGWRFRSSRYQGMLAYRRAFEVLPSSYRNFQGNAYEPLRLLLFTSGTALVPGMTLDSPSRRFLGRPTASGDTIAFVPYPQEEVLAGKFADAAGVGRAIERTRRMFYDVTVAWATALPRSAGTKEAIAISLEMLGDVGAARDSFRVARSLATDSSHRVRLVVSEVLAGVKLGVSTGPEEIRRAVLLADSVLARGITSDAVIADQLSRIAVVTGRCRQGSELLRRAMRPISPGLDIPPGVLSVVHAELVPAALGCSAKLPNVYQALERTGAPAADRVAAEYSLLGAAFALGFPDNRAAIARLASATSDYVLAAEMALFAGDTGRARTALRGALDARAQGSRTRMTADAALTEARLWIAMGDTTTAVGILDRGIEDMATAQPLNSDFLLQNALTLASTGRALVLRAEIAHARKETRNAWAPIAAALWMSADAELRPVVRRMQALDAR